MLAWRAGSSHPPEWGSAAKRGRGISPTEVAQMRSVMEPLANAFQPSSETKSETKANTALLEAQKDLTNIEMRAKLQESFDRAVQKMYETVQKARDDDFFVLTLGYEQFDKTKSWQQHSSQGHLQGHDAACSQAC
eukprot:TRINITY_DN1541_c0_g1_i1.p1 TRINITY_DN1541_c0_g1~~TRINITY_DN1541_c0_g1_i1.p1  ORF type:complete len:135 (-),score=24.54 TRINITY_DN1541_c0_g1_i1:182-586(-)